MAAVLLILGAAPALAQEAEPAARSLAPEIEAVEPAASEPAEPAAPDAIEASRQSLSERGFAFIERWEAFVGHLYNDSNGNCTIGFGHLVHTGRCTAADHARYPHGISRARAREVLRSDVGVAERAVRNDVKARLNQHQFDALVSFTFNIGTRAFRNSTLLRVLNHRHYSQVPAQMMRWVIGGPGLEARRRAEVRVWKYGDYT
jgi:lysozyme